EGVPLGADAAAGRVSQVLFPPVNAPDGAGGGAGGAGGGSLAPLYYCDTVKPILDSTCISNCHGLTPTFTVTSGQISFRLDVYSNPAGPQVGAYEKKERIKYRAAQLKDMPPVGTTPMPTDTQRQQLQQWVDTGAQYCQ